MKFYAQAYTLSWKPLFGEKKEVEAINLEEAIKAISASNWRAGWWVVVRTDGFRLDSREERGEVAVLKINFKDFSAKEIKR